MSLKNQKLERYLAVEHVCSVHPNCDMFCNKNPGYKVAGATKNTYNKRN
jgi:hypothetical protein